MDHDSYNVISAYRQGVGGYLLSSSSKEALLAYLELVMLGEFVISSSIFKVVRDTSEIWNAIEVESKAVKLEPDAEVNAAWDGVERRDRRGLSFREATILRCLMDGDSNKVIARKCNISEAP